jgi:malate dehydrogenase
VPLLSHAKVTGEKSPRAAFTAEQVDQLVKRIQFGGDEVVQAKAGAGSATLSMAYAAQVFFDDLCRAIDNKSAGPVSQVAFVAQNDSEFFATNIELGPQGLAKILPPPPAQTQKEKDLLAAAVEGLKKDIEKGLDFARNSSMKQQATK